MLQHDLEVPDSHRFDCVECNDAIEHHTQDVTWVEYEDNRMMCLVMRCRLCWNEIQIPAEKLGTGRLTSLKVVR